MKNIKHFTALLYSMLVAALFTSILGVPEMALYVGAALFAVSRMITIPAGVFGEFLTIVETDDEETKKSKSAFNQKFADIDKRIDEKTKSIKYEADKALADQKKAMEEAITEAKSTAAVALESKDKEIKDILTEMNRQKANATSERVKTMGDAIYMALEEHKDELKDWSKKGNKNVSFETKAVGTIGVPTNGVAPDFAPIVPLAHEAVHARNVIPVMPTQSDLIRFLRMTAKEGAITNVAAGGRKPGFDYTPNVIDAPVVKIAGIVTVTDEFLDDIVGSRAWLANELPQAYLDAEDLKIFKGAGGAGDIQGIMLNSQNLILPKGTVTIASNKWDQLAAASAQIRRNKRVATAAWLSPEDYMELLINKTTIGEYTYPMMVQGKPLMLGDIPIFQHTVFNQNEALVGDFARGVAIFQKMAPVVQYSTENNLNFEYNLTTIRVEARIALPIYYPDGFVHIDFNGIAS